MTILGIDYGDKKIGLAKSAGKIAVPLQIIENKGINIVADEIKNICENENIKKIVVGIPVSLSSKGIRNIDYKNGQMKKVLDFVNFFKKFFDIPIATEDERMSTKMAQKLNIHAGKKGKEDAIAAMVILQSYLDRKLET